MTPSSLTPPQSRLRVFLSAKGCLRVAPRGVLEAATTQCIHHRSNMPKSTNHALVRGHDVINQLKAGPGAVLDPIRRKSQENPLSGRTSNAGGTWEGPPEGDTQETSAHVEFRTPPGTFPPPSTSPSETDRQVDGSINTSGMFRSEVHQGQRHMTNLTGARDCGADRGPNMKLWYTDTASEGYCCSVWRAGGCVCCRDWRSRAVRQTNGSRRNTPSARHLHYILRRTRPFEC